MNKIMIIAIAALALSACGVNPNDGKRVLESHGFTNVNIGGYAFIGCGKDEFSSHFNAIDVNGKPISGVICSGWFKNYTVRMN